MATVIDSLLIELGFSGEDALSGLKKTDDSLTKARENSSKTAAEMERSGEQGALFFKKIRNEALLLLSLFAGSAGIERSVKHNVNDMAELGFTAENLNMPTEQLSAWGMAAEKAGSSAASITAAIAKANEEAVFIRAGKTEGVSEYKADPLGYFAQGGRDSELHKSGLDILLEKSRIISEINKTDAPKALAVAASMGIDEANFNFLKQGPDAVLAMVKAQEKYAAVSAQSAKEALELKNKTLTLGNEFDSIATKVLLALFPTFEKLLGKLKELADWFLAHQGTIIATVESWASAIMKLASQVDEIAQSMGGWGDIISALITIKLGMWIADLVMMAAALFKVSAGFSAIGVAGAGAVGYLAGTWINDKITDTLGQPLGGAIYDATHSGRDFSDSAFANLISKGEGDYNSVNRGAKGAGTADLEHMSLYDVFSAQKRGEFGAAGRYQLINSTLVEAMKALDLKPTDKFDKATQDKIFEQHLIKNKRSAIGDYLTGKSEDLMAALSATSKEWASVADPATGKSHYDGVGNNRASITSEQMANALKESRKQLIDKQNASEKQAAIDNIAKLSLSAKNYEAIADSLTQKTYSVGDINKLHSAATIAKPERQVAPVSNTTTSTNDTKIGTININTQATDAKGIANEIPGAIAGNNLFYQSSTGLR